jgi:hypothetical protein
MEDILRFFRAYEMWIYLGIGVLALWEIRKFGLAWNEMRGSLFGMERDSAQARLNQAATLLVFLLVMAIAEFTLVTFIVPSVPGAMPIPTSTLSILATATTTLPPLSPSVEQSATPVPTSSTDQAAPQGCVPGKVILTSPADGEQVSGVVTLKGTVDIPNLGFYSYEIARPGETIWLPIQVGREIKREDVLGTWDTSPLDPGEYMLRLVVTDGQGNTLEPCAIKVFVVAP